MHIFAVKVTVLIANVMYTADMKFVDSVGLIMLLLL